MDTRQNWFLFGPAEYEYQPCSNPCETRFVGTHEHVAGAEDPSRVENKTYIYTQILQGETSQRWTTIVQMAGCLAYHTEVPGLNMGTRSTTVFFEKWLVSKIASTFKTHVRLFFKNELVGFDTDSMYHHRIRSRDSRTSDRSNYSLGHWCSILLMST